jgi:hypothetical protein
MNLTISICFLFLNLEFITLWQYFKEIRRVKYERFKLFWRKIISFCHWNGVARPWHYIYHHWIDRIACDWIGGGGSPPDRVSAFFKKRLCRSLPVLRELTVLVIPELPVSPGPLR